MSDEELIESLRLWNREDAADRIEQLKHRLFQCATDLQIYMDAFAVSEAKLAKAVEALDEAVYLLDPDEKDMMRQAGVYRIVTTLAEIKGESHD